MDVKRICLILLLLVGCAQAQFLGYVGQQSSTQTAFTAQAANGVSPTFQNIGQGAHFLVYCPNVTFSGTISLEASTDGTFAVGTTSTLSSASYTSGFTGCRVLSAGGYYPAVHAKVSNYSSGNISATYTSLASPISVAPAALNSTGQTAPTQCDGTFSTSVAPSSTGTALVAVGLTKTLYICELTFSFSAATTAGQISVTIGACPAGTVVKTIFITASTPQIFQLTFPSGLALPGSANGTLCLVTGAITASTQASGSFTQY